MICLLLLIHCSNNNFETTSAETTEIDIVDLTLLHINDLHGWLNTRDEIGGVATYMGYFRNEGFDPSVPNSSFILVSGGDQNTGPATATLSKGEAVIDVMNLMGFDAAAIGNHEFDYGIDVMEQQQSNASFPLLSCNIYNVGTTDLANFTIPWVIQNHSGVQVGFIGLTTQSTYTSAHPKYTQYFDFGDYEEALVNYVPEVKAAGADIIIALTHIPPLTLQTLASDVSDLDITLFLGGHAGGGAVIDAGNSLVVAADHKAYQYAKIHLTYNITSQRVISKEGSLIDNIEGGVTPDAGIQALVDMWDEKINATEIISFSSTDIYDGWMGNGIGNLVTDGFINYFDHNYSFGIANRGGGFRDYFRAGNITVADVVSVIPFENNLLGFSFTGSELKEFIEQNYGSLVFSGIKCNYTTDSGFIIHSIQIQEKNEFHQINLTKSYKGLILDYSWYVDFRYDFPAFDTGIHYRDTVIDYFRSLDDLALHAFDERYNVYVPDTTPSSTSSQTVPTTNPTSIESSLTTTTDISTATLTSPGFQALIVLGLMILVIPIKKRYM